MMVHIWSWTKCAWFWAWRPIGVVRAMRHLTLVGTIACTGITVWPPAPPVEAHGPPPPAQTVITPPPSWGFPPAWGGYTPPAGTWPPVPTDTSLGPVQPVPEGARHTSVAAPGTEMFGPPELLVTIQATSATSVGFQEICDTPPASKVSEPSAFGLFAVELVLVGIWKALGYER